MDVPTSKGLAAVNELSLQNEDSRSRESYAIVHFCMLISRQANSCRQIRSYTSVGTPLLFDLLLS